MIASTAQYFSQVAYCKNKNSQRGQALEQVPQGSGGVTGERDLVGNIGGRWTVGPGDHRGFLQP